MRYEWLTDQDMLTSVRPKLQILDTIILDNTCREIHLVFRIDISHGRLITDYGLIWLQKLMRMVCALTEVIKRAAPDVSSV